MSNEHQHVVGMLVMESGIERVQAMHKVDTWWTPHALTHILLAWKGYCSGRLPSRAVDGHPSATAVWHDDEAHCM